MKPTVHWPLAFISITVISEHGKVPPPVIFFSFEIPARMACKSPLCLCEECGLRDLSFDPPSPPSPRYEFGDIG
jgi:hypothetical protein